MAKNKAKKSDKYIGVDVGVEYKSRVFKVARSQSGKSLSQWVREAIDEKLIKDEAVSATA